MVTFSDIQSAYDRIQDGSNKTPVMTSRTLNNLVQAEIYLKCENFQRGGAFKFRGTYNKLLLLSDKDKAKGIITHSSGNHAQAVALASKELGIKAVVVMPKNAPSIKVAATKGYGAEVVFCNNSVEDRVSVCSHLQQKHGYTLVHPYDDEDIIAGAGTAAYELIQEVGDLDMIFCPVGGGGLISGTSLATKGMLPKASVIGVEPARADDAARSLQQKKLQPSTYPDTIADGLRTSLSPLTFSLIQQHVDDIITVSEQQIIDAMKFLWMRMKLVVEPSGSVGFAGVCSHHLLVKNKRIGVILSGGNVDLSPFFESLDKN